MIKACYFKKVYIKILIMRFYNPRAAMKAARGFLSHVIIIPEMEGKSCRKQVR